MRTIATVFALALALLWGAKSFAQQPPAFPVDEKKIAIGAKETSADDLKKMMDSGKKVMLIHVDPADRYEKETIPGAVNIPLAELPDRLKSVPKDTTLVFTCNSGPRSSQAAKIAESQGFATASYCPIQKWKEKGYSTEPGKKG
jgi:rhodanese-related sulfurtransferase